MSAKRAQFMIAVLLQLSIPVKGHWVMMVYGKLYILNYISLISI
jgi:hypothetical protein